MTRVLPSAALARVVADVRSRPPVADLATHRALAAAGTAAAVAAPLPAGIEAVPGPGRPGSEIVRPARPVGTVLYLHSGGYGAGTPQLCRGFTARLAAATGLAFFAPAYRLAPEAPYPAALDDAEVAYTLELSRTGEPPAAVGGASAGGGLALALLMRIRDRGLPLPRAAVLISPWVDLARAPAARDPAPRAGPDERGPDPMTDPGYLAELARNYAGGTDPRDPGVSPIFGRFHDLPATHIEAGTAELLLADAVRTAGAFAAAGRAVTLSVVEEAPHTFPHSCPDTPEAAAAAARIALHLRTHLDLA
ncbi:alpha/beta hydrolase fold domain-containing protein [Pseudonocardia thermophila]|uniref:alpha/beta hydrolase fold domain-containing protein n=1 Tax=Pseudonocardia thermophila TaxID=1848 RepID=UPI00248F058A|nr:alpha/beta hydrolase fold domain-containing protein [Pseudonocardia thermophila]